MNSGFNPASVILILVLAIAANIQVRVQDNECISSSSIHNLEISLDGNQFAAVWNSNQIRLWLVESQKSVLTIQLASGVSFLNTTLSSRRDKIAASGTSGTLVWNTRDGRLLNTIPEIPDDWSEKSIFSPDGQYLMFVSHRGAKLWNLKDSTITRRFPSDNEYTAENIPLVSPDFTYIMLEKYFKVPSPITWELREINSGELLKTLNVFSPVFRSMPPILTALDREGFVLWDVPTQSPVYIPNHETVSSWLWSENGEHILMRGGLANNDLSLWDRRSWNKIFEVNPVTFIKEGSTGSLLWYAFSSDEKAFITLTESYDPKTNISLYVIDVWDAKSGILIKTFEVSQGITRFRLTGDNLVAFSIDFIERYDLKTGAKIYRYC